MKRKYVYLLITLISVIIVLPLLAQTTSVDSIYANDLKRIVSFIFGVKASDDWYNIILKIVGLYGIVEVVLIYVLTRVPTSQPIRMLIETIVRYFRKSENLKPPTV
ncbi:MAG: hypothetical protein WAS72_05810 [Saprospiraceae bacterium]